MVRKEIKKGGENDRRQINITKETKEKEMMKSLLCKRKIKRSEIGI